MKLTAFSWLDPNQPVIIPRDSFRPNRPKLLNRIPREQLPPLQGWDCSGSDLVVQRLSRKTGGHPLWLSTKIIWFPIPGSLWTMDLTIRINLQFSRSPEDPPHLWPSRCNISETKMVKTPSNLHAYLHDSLAGHAAGFGAIRSSFDRDRGLNRYRTWSLNRNSFGNRFLWGCGLLFVPSQSEVVKWFALSQLTRVPHGSSRRRWVMLVFFVLIWLKIITHLGIHVELKICDHLRMNRSMGVWWDAEWCRNRNE